ALQLRHLLRCMATAFWFCLGNAPRRGASWRIRNLFLAAAFRSSGNRSLGISGFRPADSMARYIPRRWSFPRSSVAGCEAERSFPCSRLQPCWAEVASGDCLRPAELPAESGTIERYRLWRFGTHTSSQPQYPLRAGMERRHSEVSALEDRGGSELCRQ